jgi:hypothetical protein
MIRYNSNILNLPSSLELEAKVILKLSYKYAGELRRLKTLLYRAR